MPACAEMRTWNLKSGTNFVAEIVAFPTADTVKLKRSDGKVYDLRTDYLAEAEQAYVDEERGKIWKEVSVEKLLGTASAGRYKKCAVSGTGVSSEILVTLLPSQAEAVLNTRQQQETQINALNNRIQNDSQDANAHNAAAKTGGRGYRRVNRVEAKQASQDKTDAQTSLTKLKADYDAYVKKTKSITTLRMKNTGQVYEGLQVWECQTPKR